MGKKGFLPLFIAFAAGIIILAMPQNDTDAENNILPDTDTEAYRTGLESKAKELICSLGGVKDCEVFIMLESGYGYTYASDWHTKEGSAKETDKTTVFAEYSGNKTPVTVSTSMPKVASVAVVCKKASYETQYRITELLKALFALPANRISVQS